MDQTLPLIQGFNFVKLFLNVSTHTQTRWHLRERERKKKDKRILINRRACFHLFVSVNGHWLVDVVALMSSNKQRTTMNNNQIAAQSFFCCSILISFVLFLRSFRYKIEETLFWAMNKPVTLNLCRKQKCAGGLHLGASIYSPSPPGHRAVWANWRRLMWDPWMLGSSFVTLPPWSKRIFFYYFSFSLISCLRFEKL